MGMNGLTIADSSYDCRVLAFDLVDILSLLESKAVDSEWEISVKQHFKNVIDIPS
jgi:hypothetical protein